MGEKYVHISKLDAAKRQLEIAIRLFLSYSDIVVIHTLTAAAYNVLRDLGKKQGIETIIKDYGLKRIREEYRKEFLNEVNKAENFFKHADRDGDKILKFPVGATEYLLWDACVTYEKITGEKLPLIAVFNAWFIGNHPNVIIDGNYKTLVNEAMAGLDLQDRSQFLNLLPIVSKFTT